MHRIIEAHSHEFDAKSMEYLRKKGFEKVFLMHQDADFLAKSMLAHPDFVVGFGWLPLWDGIEKTLHAVDKFKSIGCTALKICNSICPYDDLMMYPIYKKALEYKMPVSFHTGWLYTGGLKHRQLPMWYHPFTLDRVALDFPGLKILMNHTGHPFLREGSYIVKAYANVYCDLCIASDLTWDPKMFWHMIGGDVSGNKLLFKSMFGSDAFSQLSLEHFERFEKLFDALKIPQALRKRAYYKNALDFIGASSSEKRVVEVSGEPVKTGGFLDFDVARFGEPAKTKTECEVSREGSGLKLSFSCFDKNASKVSLTSGGVPDLIWQDDCVEIFISPDGKDYLHLMVNPKGQAGADKNRFTAVKFTGKATGSIKNGKWTAELFVPYELIGAKPKSGDTWGFNITRSKKTGKEEQSMWNEVSQTFHNVEGFGKLIFK